MHAIAFAREHTGNSIISLRYITFITNGRYEIAVMLHYGAFWTKGFCEECKKLHKE